MHPVRIEMEGITRYKDRMTLDLSNVPPGLVAVAGPNGAGKSTIMEALCPAMLFLEFPSRPGPMYGRASKRGAVLEVQHRYQGHLWRHLIQLDPGTGRSGASVQAFLERDGAPVPGWPTPGRASDYDAAIAALFPSKAMVLASVFAVGTGKGNFLELPRAEKRDLFTAMLGNQQLQELSKRAAKLRGLLDAAFVRLADRREILATDRQKAVDLAQRVEAARPAAAAAKQATLAARADLAMAAALATQARAALQAASAERSRIQQRRQALEARIGQAVQEQERLAHSVSADTAIEAQAAEIEQNAQLLVLLEQERAALGQQWLAANARAKDAATQKENARVQVESYRTAVTAAQERAAGLHAAAQELDRLQPLLIQAERLRAELAEAQQTVQAARAVQAEADRRCPPPGSAEASASAARIRLEQRTRTAKLLQDVPCGGRRAITFGSEQDEEMMDGDRVDCGTCGFLADARAASTELAAIADQLSKAEAVVANAQQLRAEAKTAQEHTAAAQQRVDLLSRQVKAADENQYRAADLRARVEGGDELKRRLEADTSQLQKLEADLVQRASDATEAAKDAEDARIKGVEVRAQIEKLAGAPQRLEELKAARVRLPLNEAAMHRAQEDREQARVQLEQEPALPSIQALTDAAAEAQRVEATVNDAVQQAEQEEQRAAGIVALLEGQIQALGDLGERQRRMDEAGGILDLRRTAFRNVELGMGRDGAQALEIDAAGPRVSYLVNSLLQATFDGRFSVALRTTRDSSDGKRQIETFDIEVLDGERGGLRQVEELSKGERVLVDEALKLAIACFNAERNGAAMETLYRDECDGGLDPERAARYPAMLREAIRIGGFRNVYFVSHRPEVVAQADAVIEITAAGAVTLTT